MIVDEEAAIGDMMMRMIRRLLPAAIVGAVLSAPQALEVLNAQPIDVVLTDLRMPEIDGAQLTLLIKARWAHARVVIISGSTAQVVERVVQAVRGDTYLVKPFSRGELAQVLLPLLGS